MNLGHHYDHVSYSRHLANNKKYPVLIYLPRRGERERERQESPCQDRNCTHELKEPSTHELAYLERRGTDIGHQAAVSQPP